MTLLTEEAWMGVINILEKALSGKGEHAATL